MSQDTPAKHERIERHLMRQRGAGVREVKVDFGFASIFPGTISRSNDATGNKAEVQPRVEAEDMVVRQVVKDVEVEQVKVEARDVKLTDTEAEANGSALRKPTQIKATRAKLGMKRKFTDDEEERKEEAEDSFVAGLAVKKRRREDLKDVDEVARVVDDAVQLFPQEAEVKAKRKKKATKKKKKPVTKPAKKRAARTAPEVVDEEPEPEAVQAKAAKGRRRKEGRTAECTVGAEAHTISDRNEDFCAVQREVEVAEEPVKPRERATMRKRTVQEPVDDVVDKPEPVVARTKIAKGKRRKGGQAEERVVENGVEAVLQHLDVLEEAVENVDQDSKKQKPPTRKRKVQQPVYEESPGLTLTPSGTDCRPTGGPAIAAKKPSVYTKPVKDASQRVDPDDTHAQLPATRTKPSRRGKQSVVVLQDAEEPVTKRPRKQTKAKYGRDGNSAHEDESPRQTNSRRKLDIESRPPQLQRRPLQEGDVNRSPSPRKSVDKKGSVDETKGAARSPLGDIDQRATTRRRRKHVDYHETLTVPCDIATTKHLGVGEAKHEVGDDLRDPDMVRAIEPAAEKRPSKTSKNSKAKRKPAVKPAPSEPFPPVTEQKHSEDANEPRDSEFGAEIPASTNSVTSESQNLKSTKTKRDQAAKLATRVPPLSPTAANSEQEAAADEDIDWLFAGPVARRPPEAAPTTKTARPTKTRLADIDLDDLIASVATFAHADGGAGAGIGAVKSCKGRKGRVR